MKNKFLLLLGTMIVIFSIWSLFEYKNMEARMKGFKAYDDLSWILLFIGVAILMYFILSNRKTNKNLSL